MHIILQASTQGVVNINHFFFISQPKHVEAKGNENNIDIYPRSSCLRYNLEYAINENVTKT